MGKVVITHVQHTTHIHIKSCMQYIRSAVLTPHCQAESNRLSPGGSTEKKIPSQKKPKKAVANSWFCLLRLRVHNILAISHGQHHGLLCRSADRHWTQGWDRHIYAVQFDTWAAFLVFSSVIKYILLTCCCWPLSISFLFVCALQYCEIWTHIVYLGKTHQHWPVIYSGRVDFFNFIEYTQNLKHPPVSVLLMCTISQQWSYVEILRQTEVR